MFKDTVVSLFLKREEELQDKPCLHYKSQQKWTNLSWSQTKEKVAKLAASLETLGIRPQDRVSILANTRYEWTLIDLAILAAGGVTVPIYQSVLPKEVHYILEHAETKIVFVENLSQLKKVEEYRRELPQLRQIILIEGEPPPGVLSLQRLIQDSEAEFEELEKKVKKLNLDALASIVYTSGTTGEPKGVMLTHTNLVSEFEAWAHGFQFSHDEVQLLFLPLAHVLARAGQFYSLCSGFALAYAESVDKLAENIREVRPHLVVGVPRIFEKIYHKISSDIEHSNSIKKGIFKWALKVGQEVSRFLQQRKSIPTLLAAEYRLATTLVFSKIQSKLGGRIRFFISGGAPLSKEIALFFHAAGLLILEGYGLTETNAAMNCNLPHAFKLGTVGQTLDHGEEKIAEDGEILVRGTHVFKGYYKNEEATREAFTKDGFFKTGDIGEIDSEGYLKITDRKKDIIITAGGKNIAPQYIENLLKQDPLFSQAMIYGDRKKFLSALVTLNPEEVRKLGAALQIEERRSRELIDHPQINQEVQKRIEEKNKELASYETIKRFAILPEEFTIESGELTPSLKVKRKKVIEKYRDLLESFYHE